MCRNSGAIHLSATRSFGRLADKICINFEFLNLLYVDQFFKLFAAFNKVTALLEQYECI